MQESLGGLHGQRGHPAGLGAVLLPGPGAPGRSGGSASLRTGELEFMGLDAEECLPSVTVGDGPSGVTSSQRRGRGGREGAARTGFVNFFSAYWKFPGRKGTSSSPGHSPRGRAPRPGLEPRRGIRNRSTKRFS